MKDYKFLKLLYLYNIFKNVMKIKKNIYNSLTNDV